MHFALIAFGSVFLIWITLVYLSFYWPPCIRAVKYFGYTLIAIGMLNFTSFFIISLFIGGDAAGNPPINGKYYVSDHGRQTEVSRSVYEYSLLHAHSVWVTHPLAVFGFCLLYGEDKKREAKPTN